ncbi:MAG: PAS domain-containing protein, partial [Rhizobium sp.]|nr:PAS domain-containing protein [Rhizobium sp.]
MWQSITPLVAVVNIRIALSISTKMPHSKVIIMEVQKLLIAFLAQLGVVSFALTLCSLGRDRVRGELSLLRKIGSGVLFGVTAAVLMSMADLVDAFRFDLRIVPIAVVGLISGPVGATVAAAIASAERIRIGGAGADLGLLAIGLAYGVAIFGWAFAKRGYRRSSDVVTFSALNAGIALLILFLMPSAVRDQITKNNAHLVILLLNFVGTLIATFFVRIDQLRRENGNLNELHKQIVFALPDALSVKDLGGRFLIANGATASLMGAGGPADMVGKTDFDYYHFEEASRFWEQERMFMQAPTPTLLEQQFERDGQTVWLSTIKAPYKDEDGKLKGIVSHTSDVTAQKALLAELGATQALLQT